MYCLKKYRFSYFLLAFFLISCSTQKDFITEYDYSFEGRFKKYKTFKFIRLEETDTSSMKPIIEKTIGSRLVAQGYRYSSRRPDLLIGYRVYKNDFKLKGYNQPALENYLFEDSPERFLDDENREEDLITIEDSNEEYLDFKLNMRQGTLLITFYDRRMDRTVWSGYASGVFSREDQNIERSLKSATSKIFKKFRLLADGYVVN
ncbi:MAG: DUF4136 domain-containing protein [Reichenbachiella sp.]